MEDGEILWSQSLPNWCRLSSHLKAMLESLFLRLFETNQGLLMKYEEFFNKIDQIIHLIPIYYLNLKKLTLTCTYLKSDDSIDDLFDEIREENNDGDGINYHCLFQKYNQIIIFFIKK